MIRIIVGGVNFLFKCLDVFLKNLFMIRIIVGGVDFLFKFKKEPCYAYVFFL
jgi:hypothetical protein